MKHKRIFVFICLLVVTSILISACATATEAPTSLPATEAAAPATEAPTSPPPTEPPQAVEPTAEAPAEVVELKYFYRITSPQQEAFETWVIDSFNQKFDGKIHVTGSGVDDETFKTKIAIDLRSPEPPDIFYSWEGGRAKSIIDAGHSAVLDAFYDEFGWNDSINPAGISLATFDGKKYFVPYNMSGSFVWYRPDIYEELGLTVPETWEDLLANCQVITDSGKSCFITGNKLRWPAQFDWGEILVNKHGLEVYQQLLNNQIPWTDPRVVDAFAVMKQMVDDGLYYPGINSMDYAETAIPFTQGDAVHEYMGTWFPGTIKGDAADYPVPLDFFTYPKFGDVRPTTEVFAENTLMIHARSQHLHEAAEFVNYYVSTEVQTKYVQDVNPFPANINVDISGLTPLMARVGKAMAEAGFYTYMHVDHGFDPAIADTFLNSLQAVLGDAMTPEEAAQATESEAVSVRGEVQQ
jgi:raffinose/stachyose/melibiose transport system substrate-binding protein